jgi:hypothetical protein
MASTEYEIIDAEWPEHVSASRKALIDFLASGKQVAEIKGNKTFLANVRRVARTNSDFNKKIEFRMRENRLFVRRRENANS